MKTHVVVAILVGGWLAEQLARTDADVDRGVAAYEARSFDEALAAFDAAIERRGERPELSLDRGLVLLAQDDREGAKTAFERASESEDPVVRSSASYELGNLAFDAEDWEGAIEHYIDALKARPDHANAKWNLELALQRKKDQEEEQEKQEQQGQDGEEQQDGEQDPQEQGGEDSPSEGGQDEQDGTEEPEPQDEGEQPEQEPGEQDEGEQEQPEPQDQGEEAQPEQDQGEQGGEPPPSAAPMEQMDLDRALEQLDEQDPFAVDKPVGGGYVQPEKDW